MVKITLASARENAGLSIEKVAEIMHKSKNTITNWENGKTSLKVHDFVELCNLYKISNDYIILPNNLLKEEKEAKNGEKILN